MEGIESRISQNQGNVGHSHPRSRPLVMPLTALATNSLQNHRAAESADEDPANLFSIAALLRPR